MTRRNLFPDLLVGTVICGALLSLVMMSVVRSRAAARGRSCGNNLKQLGLAIHNYHSAYRRIPFGAGGTDQGGDKSNRLGNAGRLSAFVGLSPFYEQQRLWEMISNPRREGSQVYPPMGPEPWHDPKKYLPWGMRPDILVCPDDASASEFPVATSYVLNYGDGIQQVGSGKHDWPSPRDQESLSIQRAVCRGVFAKQIQYGFRDILDGLSNTMMVSEMQIDGPKVARNVVDLIIKPSLARKAQSGNDFWPAGRESAWCDGALRSAGFQAVLAPGSPSATSDLGETTAVMSASSHHGKGAHVLMCDGAVIFVTGTIDAGNPDSPSVALPLGELSGANVPAPGSTSPYGLWGALGTRAGKETIEETLGESKSTGPPRNPIDRARLAELKEQPAQTFTAADKQSQIQGWLVSCSRKGDLLIVTVDGKEKRLTLADLVSEEAYSIVQAGLAKKIESRKSLLPQLKQGVALLEDKKFNEFLDQFIDKQSLPKLEQAAQLSEVVFKQRGLVIQAFDDAIFAMESPASGVVELDDTGLLVGFPSARRSLMPLAMQYRDGRWYWSMDADRRRPQGRFR